MGSELSKQIEEKQLSPGIRFLKGYMSNEIIDMLKSINEDYLLDEEFFCSFFVCDEHYFQVFNNSKTGLICLWDILTTIYLIKFDLFKTKTTNILSLFVFSHLDTMINQSQVEFMCQTVINCIKRIYDCDEYAHIPLGDEESNQKEEVMQGKNDLVEKTMIYIKNAFKKVGDIERDEVEISHVKKYFEGDENLFILFSKIGEDARAYFEL